MFEESEQYLDSLPIEHVRTARELVGALQSRQSASLVLAIPIHYKDYRLKQYLKQLCIGQKTLQVYLFINASRASVSDEKFADAVERNKDIAKRWSEQNQDHKIEIIARNQDVLSMGLIRKLLIDTILLHQIESHNDSKLYVVNHDIDQLEMSPNYFEELEKVISNHSQPIFISGRVGYGYLGKKNLFDSSGNHNPELYIFNKIQDSINYCCREGLIGPAPRIWPEGANFSFPISAYWRAGGFNISAVSGEDDELGAAFYKLYSNPLAQEIFSRPRFSDKSWIGTDPRRILATLLSGRTGIEAWAWKPFFSLPGHLLDTCKLEPKTTEEKKLISKCDLGTLKDNDNHAVVNKIRSRIEWNFFRSVIFDRRARNSKELKNVAREFGLYIEDGILDYSEGAFEATVDWNRSPILQDLVELVDDEMRT